MSSSLTAKKFSRFILGDRLNRFRLKFKLACLHLSNLFSPISATGQAQFIVSLTSHGSRVDSLWIPLECIALGRLRPQRIIVWLNSDLKYVRLNSRLLRLRRRGVEFKYAPDLGPHTKYYYSLQECLASDLPLVTIDDDCIYWGWFLQRLSKASHQSPNSIIGYRVRRMRLSESESILPYHMWGFASDTHDHPLNFVTGVSGAFYPLSFVKILASYGTGFIKTCLKADDVWLNYIAARAGYPVRQLYSGPWDFPLIEGSQVKSLWSSNKIGGNDSQITSTYDQNTLEALKRADAESSS